MRAAGATGRVRVLLEGTGSLTVPGGGELHPKLEAGLRYDGDDAETGAGIELGTGIGYSVVPLSARLDARRLLAHEDAAYEEWGFSASVAFRPRDDGKGLSLDVGSAWGVTQSGVESLWASTDVSGLTRDGPMSVGQRFETRLAYGIAGRRVLAGG